MTSPHADRCLQAGSHCPRIKFADRRSAAALCIIALTLIAPLDADAACTGVATIQVLGSGGPDANDARASSGYLLWMDGEARLLVDAGGGVFLRFGEAKAKFESLDAIAITHLHADHVGELPVMLKSGFFSERTRSIPIVGPSGGGQFPGMTEFMKAQFDKKRGAFRYLSGYLDGSGGSVRADIKEISATASRPKAAFGNEHFKLTGIGVKHGPVPALAYIVEAGGKRLAFAGDQNGDNPAFTAAIKDADVLVMDHAIPEMPDRTSGQLHARPSEIGMLAAKANVRQLVLSHNMARSLGPLQDNLALIKQHYSGAIKVAEDLMCIE